MGQHAVDPLSSAHNSFCELIDNYLLPLYESSKALLEEINSILDTRDTLKMSDSLNIYADYLGLFDCLYQDMYSKVRDNVQEWKNIFAKLEKLKSHLEITMKTQQYKRPTKITRNRPAFRLLPELFDNYSRIFAL